MKERDLYFDNAKLILIFLVVLGHYCGSYHQSFLMIGVYDFIYSFHMPLFIFISGYFSKSITNQRIKDINRLLIPYFFIQLYYIIFLKTIGHDQSWLWSIPIMVNWYLLGLFIWRLFIPFFNQVSNPIIIAFTLSLSVGFFSEFNNYLDFQRIIAFMPFFVIGYFSESILKHIKLQNKKNHMVIIAWILITLSVLFFVGITIYSNNYGNFIKQIFIPSLAYHERFGSYGDFGLIFRGGFFVIAIIMSYLILLIIPDKRVWFTSLGERGLYVYVFHMFPVILLREFTEYSPFVSELFAIPFSIIVTLFFTMKPIGIICEIIMNPLTIPARLLNFQHDSLRAKTIINSNSVFRL